MIWIHCISKNVLLQDSKMISVSIYFWKLISFCAFKIQNQIRFLFLIFIFDFNLRFEIEIDSFYLWKLIFFVSVFDIQNRFGFPFQIQIRFQFLFFKRLPYRKRFLYVNQLSLYFLDTWPQRNWSQLIHNSDSRMNRVCRRDRKPLSDTYACVWCFVVLLMLILLSSDER